jgi:hypothetical protein
MSRNDRRRDEPTARKGQQSSIGDAAAMLDFIIELLYDFSSERVRIGCAVFLLVIVAGVCLAAWLRVPPF